MGLEIKDETPGKRLNMQRRLFTSTWPVTGADGENQKLAHDELRTHEMQALYIIRKN